MSLVTGVRETKEKKKKKKKEKKRKEKKKEMGSNDQSVRKKTEGTDMEGWLGFKEEN